MAMKICYEVTNTNFNDIYIPINIGFEGYNRYELCTYIDSDCPICFEKSLIFRIHMQKKQRILHKSS